MSDLDAVNVALLLLRAAVGVTFIAHGWNHIFGGGKIEGTAGWFESLGMRPGKLHAWMASIVELAAGAMLVVGLGTSVAAAAVVGVMVVAWVTNHRTNGFFIFRPGEGWEYVMNLTVAGIALSALGAGELSLDHVLELDEMMGSTGLLIGLVAGVGGGLGLLAGYWRPDPPAATPAEEPADT